MSYSAPQLLFISLAFGTSSGFLSYDYTSSFSICCILGGRSSGSLIIIRYTVSHFSLFQRLQKAWLGYDSYARVFMVLATNQTLMTLSDFALGYNSSCPLALSYISSTIVRSTMVGDHEVWGAWAFVVVVTTAAMLHIRMNLTFESYNELLVMIVLTYLPPLTATVAATLDYAGQASTGDHPRRPLTR